MKFFFCIAIIFGVVAAGQAAIARADFSNPSKLKVRSNFKIIMSHTKNKKKR